MFLQWWLHFRPALACCRTLVHLDLRPPTPPQPTWRLVQPQPPVNVLASPPVSVFPSSTHLPNALSSFVCVSCVVQRCVCACVCVCHVHSVNSSFRSPLSPLLTSASCLSVTWISPLRALLSVTEMYQIFPPNLLILMAPSR